jgi:hypothetical protein
VNSDIVPSYIYMIKNIDVCAPSTIFLSLRSRYALIDFANNKLPYIYNPFVLVTGSSDRTIPRQVDMRYRSASKQEKIAFDKIANSRQLIHWYAENLDLDVYQKVSPIPLGLLGEAEEKKELVLPVNAAQQRQQVSIFCANRVRTGAQWENRRKAAKCVKGIPNVPVTVVEEEIPFSCYLELLAQHSFVVCAEGGG